MYLYVCESKNPWRLQKDVGFHILWLQVVVSHIIWMLEAKFGSSASLIHDLKYRAIHLAMDFIFLYKIYILFL